MGIFDFLRRRNTNARTNEIPPLYFKDGTGAFEYTCRFMDCALTEGAFLPALVLDPVAAIGAKAPVQRTPDGNQIALLRIASADGGFPVLASTVAPNGPELVPGTLVAWRAAKQLPELAAAMGESDPRCGWVGLILGTLKPEHRNGQWVADRHFMK